MRRYPRVVRGAIVGVAVVAMWLAAVPGGLAATFTVTTTSFADTGGCDASCNLVEAIQAANGSPGVDTINLPNLGAPYQPTLGLPTLSDVSLVGIGTPAPQIDGQLAGNVNGLLFSSGLGPPGVSTVTNVSITRFQQQGIFVAPSQVVTVTRSFIGTDSLSSLGLGNGDGIMLNSASSIVGGTTAGDGNVISGNTGWGIMLQQATATGNTILRNVIGSSLVANGSGGIWVLDAPNTRIGSATPGQGNSIAGNGGSGILIEGASSAGTVVEGNEIGSDGPNDADGIHVGNGVTNVTIGGSGAAGNTIESNAGAGVVVFGPDTPATGIRIRGNHLDENGGLGIDLGSDGVTANDGDDSDTGPNQLQNFPVIASVGNDGSAIAVSATLDSTPTTTFDLDFYVTGTCDGSGYGEGRTTLVPAAPVTATTDSGGHADIGPVSIPLQEGVGQGDEVTMTATDPAGNTSEFSQCSSIPAPSGGTSTFTVDIGGEGTTAGCTVGDCSLREAIEAANANPNGSTPDTIDFSVAQVVPTSALPAIDNPVVVDGGSTDGPPGIEIAGSNGPGTPALVLAAGSGGSTIQTVLIRDFQVGIAITSSGNTVVTSHIQGATDAITIGGAATGNTIGGDDSVGNTIWSFAGAGVQLAGAGPGNTVAGNTIGLTPAGVPTPSDGNGVEVSNTTGTIVGDNAVPGDGSADRDRGNVIGGVTVGVLVGTGADGTRIAGNYIGVDRSGADKNLGAGVRVSGSNGSSIGPFNTIASTNGIGVEIESGSGNRIVANEIRDNTGEGIFLDEGANGGLSAPILESTAALVGGTTTIDGSISGGPANTLLFVEFFTNAECDPSSSGEGRTYIFFVSTTTDEGGNSTFTFTSPTPVVGEVVTATATNSATNDTSGFSNCATVVGGAASAVLDAVQTSVPSTGTVPLADVPGSAFLPPPGATQSSGLEGAPISNIPISNIPISNIPISNIPISNIPISNIGFDNPTILPLLRAFPLSELPLVPPRSWPALLAGSALAGSPLQSVTLQDALALPAVQALTMADIDLTHSRLGQLPAVATVLGTAPLSSLPLPGGADWCALAGPGVQCSPSSSVLSIGIQGAPISNIPISNIPISNIPISNIPISNIPISNIPISNIPISNIPISNIPISNIPISNIETLINCAAHPTCPTATLYDAFVGHWFLPTATVGDLLRALVGPPDVTNGATLGDVLILLFSSMSNLSWEQLDLDTAGLQAAADAGNTIDWHADVGLSGGAALATVILPKGTVYDSSFTPTVQSLPAGAPVTIAPPQIGTDASGNVTLEWTLLGVIGGTARVSFRTFPPLRVGPQAGSLEATAGSGGGTPVESLPAPFSVSETFEPNGEGSPEPVNPDSLYLSYVTQADDLDFYSLPAPPAGSTIRVFLSHLPADYDLALYSPNDAALRPVVAGTEPLDSPPLVDTGVPLGTEQAALPPETLDDLRIDQSLPLVGVSANRGTEDDSIVAVSGGGSGNYLIQVTPYNGATSDEPYMLRVEVDPPRVPLTAAPLPSAAGTTGTVPASLPAGTNTLFLWNRSQLTGLYGAGPADSVLTAMQDTQGELASLGFPSAIVGVDGNAAVAGAMAAWNADSADPGKANAVVRAINAVVDGLRAQPNGNGIEYLVLVGGDRAMPFARLEDYVTLSNESDYAQSVGSGNELSAALGAGQMLSDDAYADTSPVSYLNRQLFVPDLSVGRLVETPAEIVAALARYRDFNGVLDPATARVAGYDFLADGAEDVRRALDARAGLAAPAEPTLIGDTWARDDLIAALFPTGGQPPDIASLNGHADHHQLKPPAGATLFTTSDLTADAAATLPNRLVLSMGCHAGLSVDDALIAAQGLDWPQAYSREGATYLGNTTFGYGDTAVVAYSEELNRLLAEQVSAGGPIGDALRLAKNEYFSTRGVFGVYDEKSMAAFTLYGLPMWSIGPVPQAQSLGGPDAVQPLARAARSVPAASVAPLAIPTTTVGTDPVTGLAVEKFDASPAFTPVTVGGGTFLRGDSGVQVSHLRPIQPKLVLALGGTQGHGALITGLSSSDASGVNPVYARPIVDLSADEPELAFNDVAYPSKLLTVRTYLTSAGERQRLVMGTGQFFGNPTVVDAPGTGTQRRYTRIEGQVYRSTSNDRLAPTFTKIDAFVVSGNAAFSVDVAGGDATRVLAGYRSGTSSVWQFVDLAEGPNGHWSGGGPVAANQFEYFLQVVDEAGNVGVSTNKGFYFDGAALPTDTNPNGPLELDPPAPNGENGWYTGAVAVAVVGPLVGPDGVPVQVSVDGGPFQDPGADNAVTVSGDGVHVLTARAATGETDTVLVPIDGTPPEVVFGTPSAGATYQPGASLAADYSCVDRGSGATSCAGTVAVGAPISTTLGQKTFTVTSRDRAGNETTRSVTYTVAYRKILFSSSRSGFGDIYAINPDGTGLTRLTNELAPDEEPAWSPDGSQIAFASRRNALTQDIYVMNADGSNVRRLTTATGDDTAPAWSPDGSKIAFRSSRDRNFEIYVMNADGSGQTRLTNNRSEDLSPTWSPDGSKIAWSRGSFLRADVYVMNADGSSATRIARDASDPDWSVNGKIAFTRSLFGAFVWEVYTMNANGSGLRRLTTARGPDFDPAWSTDGQQIVFSSGRNRLPNLEIYVMGADGSGQTRVTERSGLDRTPDW